MFSENSHEKWKSFKLTAFTVFTQFRKDQPGGGDISPSQQRIGLIC